MFPAMLGINLADNPSAMRQVQRIRQDSCKYAKRHEREQGQPWQPQQHEGGHQQRRRMNQIAPHACMRRKKNQSDENRNAGQFQRLAPCRLLRTASSSGGRWRTGLLPRSPVRPFRSAHRRLHLCAVLLRCRCCRRWAQSLLHSLLSNSPRIIQDRLPRNIAAIESHPACTQRGLTRTQCNGQKRSQATTQIAVTTCSGSSSSGTPQPEFRGLRTHLRYRTTPLLHRNATR